MKKILIELLIIVAGIAIIIFQSYKISNLKESRDIYKRNMDSALTECITWKTKDSLSVAKNNILTLRVKELEKYYNDSYKEINSLKKKNESLESIVNNYSNTKVEIITQIKDSVIIRDSIVYNSKTFNWKDNWVSVNGSIINDSVQLDINSRDSLTIGITTKYKRFLGFLWRTKKIEEQSIYAISKNPHNTIENIECVNVKK